MAKHQTKKYTKFVKSLEQHGFTVQEKSNHKFLIFKDNGPSCCTHIAEKCFHPIRRFVKNKYSVVI